MKHSFRVTSTFRGIFLAIAYAAVLGRAFAQDKQEKKPTFTGSPAAQRLARSHKIFLGVESSTRDDLTQSFYNALSAKLQSDNGYQLVDDAKDAELILYLSIDQWNAHLAMVDGQSRVITWSITAWVTGWHGTGNQVIWLGQEAKGAQWFSDELKALAGAPSTPAAKDSK